MLLRFEGNEGTVLDTMETEGRVQTGDPESTEGAFLGPAVAVGVLTGLDDRFFGLSKKILSSPAVAFGGLQDILVAFLGHDTTLYSRHMLAVKGELR